MLRRQAHQHALPRLDRRHERAAPREAIDRPPDLLDQLGRLPPVRLGQEDIELKLRAVDPKTVVVEPYPFDQSPLRVSVRAKLIPRIAYKSQEAFRETYAKAQREQFEFTLMQRDHKDE